MGGVGRRRSAVLSYFLFVDDDPDEGHLIRRAFAKSGRESVTVETPNEALVEVRNAASSIVALVTDMRMPGYVDGAELAREVKAIAPGLPVILLTGAHTTHPPGLFDAVLLKSSDYARLVGDIDRVLQGLP